MKNLLLLFLVIGVSISAYSQEIAGTVSSDQAKALSGASVSLKKLSDSSVVKLSVTNSEGKYKFSNISDGKYFIDVTHVGYLRVNSSSFEVSGTRETRVPAILLAKASGSMKEVSITAIKPMVEVKADKIVLNVEGSTNSVGQDALELLKKSPGVVVDKDDNISLSGKNGVQVYIDGKPTPLSGQDLSAYLKSLQSSSIEAIEIITNPSAKYEAAGNAGIINIRLKKSKAIGTNGSVNAGYNIGVYPKYNAGFSLNHRNKNINIYSNYSYNNNTGESFMFLKRTELDTLFDLSSLFKTKSQSHNFKGGLDYFINKKSTVGVMVNGNFNHTIFDIYNRTPISYVPTGDLAKTLVANNTNDRTQHNVNFNLNYRYADTSGRELNMDADAGAYRITSNQWQPNDYYDQNNAYAYSHDYQFVSPSNINIYSFKADYSQNFQKGKLGFGGKSSYVNTVNDFNSYNVFSSTPAYDSARSNNFDYKEYINALYATYDRAYKHINMQFGVRMENTNLEGISSGFIQNTSTLKYDIYKADFKRNYTDFFPSAGLTFAKNPMKQWAIRYSRRIDRPAYQDLNPFEFKLDEYSYMKGNTDLRPQYTNSFALTYTYKYTLNATLNYSHVNDVFTQLVDTTETSKSFLTKKNLATQDVVSLNISYPYSYKWYTIFANVNASYSIYKANFGVGRTVDVEAYNLNVYQQHSFKLGKGYSAELSSYYSSPGIWQGTFKTKSMWGIDAGLLKNVLNNKGTIKTSLSDIFQTMRWSAKSEFAGQTIDGHGGWESRVFKINFTYRFGNNQVKAARQRQTGAEDEKQRVNSQGGLGGQ